MALKDLYERYETQTKELSNICRQLGFSAGAIIWLFRTNETVILPCIPLVALVCLLIYFLFDILQYHMAATKTLNRFTACHIDYKKKVLKLMRVCHVIEKK